MSESQGIQEQTSASQRQPALGLVIGFVAVLILAWLVTSVVWRLSDLANWLTAVPLVMTIGTVTLAVAVLTVPVPRRRPASTRLALGGLALVDAVDLFFSASLATSDETSLSDQARDWWSGLYLEIGIRDVPKSV
jgi:hypothetical protein